MSHVLQLSPRNTVHILVPLWYHHWMRPRIQDLIKQLEATGFIDRGGMGNHKNYRHPNGINLTVRGEPGDTAKHYIINDIRNIIYLIDNEGY